MPGESHTNKKFSQEGCVSLPDTIASSTMEDLPTRYTANLFNGTGGIYSKDLKTLVITAACLRALMTTDPCLKVQDKHENVIIAETVANKLQRKPEDASEAQNKPENTVITKTDANNLQRKPEDDEDLGCRRLREIASKIQRELEEIQRDLEKADGIQRELE